MTMSDDTGLVIAAAIEKAGEAIADAVYRGIMDASIARMTAYGPPKGHIGSNRGYGEGKIEIPFELPVFPEGHDRAGHLAIDWYEDPETGEWKQDLSTLLEAATDALAQLEEVVQDKPPIGHNGPPEDWDELAGRAAQDRGAEPSGQPESFPKPQGQAGTPGRELDPAKRLPGPPKAADRVEGTWWMMECQKYVLKPGGPDGVEELEFWSDSGQRAQAWVKSNQKLWPKAWIESGKMQYGGPWPFEKSVIITQQVSPTGKKNTKDFFYVDLVAIQVKTNGG
jgi:hypothetical protein